MEFKISRGEFQDALASAQGVIEKRNTVPILSNVLLCAEKNEVSLVATDLDVGVKRVCACQVSGPGKLTLEARLLYDIVRQASSDTIHILSSDDGVEVVAGHSRFRMLTLDPKEFPSVPGLEEKAKKRTPRFSIKSNVLSDMIKSTIFAVSLDETRYNLSGVYVEGREGALRMVATDGHRLALIDGEVEGVVPGKGVILPRKGLSEARRLLEVDPEAIATLTIDEAIARLTVAASEFFMRLVDGEFPDYRPVIPKGGKIRVSLPREELIANLRSVSLMSTERPRGVSLTIQPNQLSLRTKNPDKGEASAEMEIRYTGSEVTIGFNSRYLLEALQVMPVVDAITLEVSDDASPGVLRPERDGTPDERYCYVVMPMRL